MSLDYLAGIVVCSSYRLHGLSFVVLLLFCCCYRFFLVRPCDLSELDVLEVVVVLAGDFLRPVECRVRWLLS